MVTLISSSIFFTFLVSSFTIGPKKLRAVLLLCLPFMVTNRGRGILIMNCFNFMTLHITPNIEENLFSLQKFYECNKKVFKAESKKAMSKSEFYTDFNEAIMSFKESAAKSKENLRRLKVKTKKSMDTLREKQKSITAAMNVSCDQLKERLMKKCVRTIDGAVDKINRTLTRHVTY